MPLEFLPLAAARVASVCHRFSPQASSMVHPPFVARIRRLHDGQRRPLFGWFWEPSALPSSDALDALGIHRPAHGPQHRGDPAKAIAAIPGGHTNDVGGQRLAQPMGFYAPAQIVRDARDHSVEIRPVCINASRWDCTLEPVGDDTFAVRLGFRLTRGLSNKDGAEIVTSRRPAVRAAPTSRLPRWCNWRRPTPWMNRLGWLAAKPYRRSRLCG
jgi:hypothetical protein